MRYRQLGKSDLTVPELALGSWLTYGVSVEEETARACIHRAFDHGINFFDTANMYGRGAAESLLGTLLRPFDRKSYLLATKVYFPMSDKDRGLSRKQIHKQIDASLKRLGTDYVDLYQCHRYDEDTPIEETMSALSEVVDAGKARHIGFSRWKPKQIKLARRVETDHWFVSNQPQYSMLHRKPERRVFPLCEELGIGQMVYSPLAQGVLTGKYRANKPPPAGSRADDPRLRGKSRRFFDNAVLDAVHQLNPLARDLSLTMSQLALAWVLQNDLISAAIIGASRPEQIDENVGAVGVRIDVDVMQRIDQILDPVVRR